MKRREAARLAGALGAVVRAERIRNGLSQEQLAEKADVHRNYVSLVERGLRDPSFSHLAAIAVALGMRPERLVPRALRSTERAAGR